MSGDRDRSGRGEPLRLVHHHPGRLRMRSDFFLGNEVEVERVREALDSIPGIRQVTHNPRTGSLLIEYEPGFAEPDAILARVAAAAGLDGVVDDADGRHKTEPATVLIDAVKGLNAVTEELTGGRAGLEMLVPTALASVAVYSLVNSKDLLPRWDNLLYWSYSIFVDWHRREIQERRARANPMT